MSSLASFLDNTAAATDCTTRISPTHTHLHNKPKKKLSGIGAVFYTERANALLLQKNTLSKMNIWIKQSVLDSHQKTQLTLSVPSVYRALLLYVFRDETQGGIQHTERFPQELPAPRQVSWVETAKLAWMKGDLLVLANRKYLPGSALDSAA